MLRFSGTMQVGNWIADVQLHAFVDAPHFAWFQIELAFDNGKHWSAAVGIEC